MRRTVSPSRESIELAEVMLSEREVMREILDETIPSPGDDDVTVYESGRTVCGPDRTIRGPLARFPSSIELSECPRGTTGGTWHTHVTKDQLRDPTNSLPDSANVIFGDIDVSAVVGTRTVELMLAPEDPEAGIEEYQNALGVEAQSPEDVIDAVLAGRVNSPETARNRLRSNLSSLFVRERTGFRDLDSLLQQSSVPAHSPSSFEFHEAKFYESFNGNRAMGHTKHPKDAQSMKAAISQRADAVMEKTGIAPVAKDAAVAEVVSKAIRSVL